MSNNKDFEAKVKEYMSARQGPKTPLATPEGFVERNYAATAAKEKPPVSMKPFLLTIAAVFGMGLVAVYASKFLEGPEGMPMHSVTAPPQEENAVRSITVSGAMVTK